MGREWAQERDKLSLCQVVRKDSENAGRDPPCGLVMLHHCWDEAYLSCHIPGSPQFSPLPPNPPLPVQCPARESTLSLPSLISHKKRQCILNAVIYGEQPLPVTIHLSSQGHICWGASIPETTHIHFLPGTNGLGNSRNAPKLQTSVGGPSSRNLFPKPEPYYKSPCKHHTPP